MIKYFSGYLLLISICISCVTESEKSKPLQTQKTITDTISSSTGQELILKFHNDNEAMVLQFQNEDFVLKNQKPASGIWYKGESFEVRGKGKRIEVYKNGKLIFKK